MLFILFLFSLGSAAPTEGDDLQVVGSDKYYAYQPQQTAYAPSDLRRIAADIRGAHLAQEPTEPPRAVQRIVDKDGNVRIVTSFNSRDDGSQPASVIYERPSVRPRIQPVPIVQNDEEADSSRYTAAPTELVTPRKKKYSKTQTVRFPNDSGGAVAHQEGSSLKDANSASYNHRTSYEKNYKKPERHVSHDVPLEASGSSYSTSIEEDDEDDEFEPHSGPVIEKINIGDPGEEHYIVHGHDHRHGHDHGHGFKKEKGASYSHGEKEAQGGESTSGHKSKEKYEKGHAEKHGHEEHKGGKKEKKGEKAGHIDEGNHYSKGHEQSHGGKGSEHEHVEGHKKGHKKKGYRKVHHKDEYKKDEEFFDEELDEGHKKKHGHDHHAHKHEKGGAGKKGHHNSGYKEGHKGYESDKEEGESHKKVKGGASKSGHKHHHGHQAHYHKGAGHKKSEAHAHGHEHEEEDD